MPVYEHGKDYPFAAFITNLGKYNEGELVGEWVQFPTTHEELQAVFKRIGIGAADDFGNPYEEWFITDYDCYVDGLYDKLGEYENLDELNYLASKLNEMDRWDYERFQAAMELGDHSGSVREIINLTENLDCYDIYPDIEDYDDLGRYYIDELDAMQVPEHLKNYIDYEAYGRDIAMDENGGFTDQGYVRDAGNSFDEVYDGDRENIPEEYRVMSSPEEELTEDEKSEWAMDLAFDLDEFFRLNDPTYAEEHLDEHAAKEEIYENLIAGRVASLEERLAACGQKERNHLPSALKEYKEATGYEDYLDIDTAAIREAIQNPDNAHIDEIISFAEQAEREYAAEAAAFVQTPENIVEQARAVYGEPATLSVLVVEPMKEPYVKEIGAGLAPLQAEVGGSIQVVYPYDDMVGLVCNEEGKLDGLELNRALRDEDGKIYDVVAGTFLVVGLSEDNFASLPPELAEKYAAQFKDPEKFVQFGNEIVAVPVQAEPRQAPENVPEQARAEAASLAAACDDAFREHTFDYGVMFQDEDARVRELTGMILEGKTCEVKTGLINMGREEGVTAEAAPLIARLDAFEKEHGINTYMVYQLKGGDETRDYRYEGLDRLKEAGLAVKPENYELVYAAPLTPADTLESIYTDLNINRPEDFKGHSLSVSDIVVMREAGRDSAHYCDSPTGFAEVPEFLDPAYAPDRFKTGERISTPRGSFSLTDMSRQQIEAAGYGFHHQSDDGKYLIMANGTRAFAIQNEQAREKDNPLRTAEMTLEDDYGMIDGVINNGRRGEELEKAKEAARLSPEKKPSIMDRLAEAKRECAEHKPSEKAAPQKKPPELGDL